MEAAGVLIPLAVASGAAVLGTPLVARLATGLWSIEGATATWHLGGLVLGGVVILALGVWDDRFGMGAGP